MTSKHHLNLYLLSKYRHGERITKIYQHSPTLIFSLALFISLTIDKFLFVLIFLLLNLLIIKSSKYKILFIVTLISGLAYAANFTHNIEKDIRLISTTAVSYEAKVIEPVSAELYQMKAVVSIKGLKSDAVISTALDTDLNYLDSIVFTGKLRKIDNTTSYGRYLNSKNIYLEGKDVKVGKTSKDISIVSKANQVKFELESRARKILPDAEAAFLNGLIFGTKTDLPEDLQQDFQRTGTSHIVAASGFNVVVVYLAIKLGLQKLFKFKHVLIISIIAVWIYSFMLGGYNIPALRATIMLTIYLLAKLAGRKSYITLSLLLTSLILLIMNPELINNISFQLSTLAVLGLILFSKNIKNLLLNLLPDNFITDGISTTIAATILTVPITFNAFETTSILAVLVNLIILPLIPIIMLAGFIAILAMNLPLVPTMLVIVLSSMINFIVEILGFFSRLNFISTSNIIVTLIYICILISILLLSDYLEFRKKISKKT